MDGWLLVVTLIVVGGSLAAFGALWMAGEESRKEEREEAKKMKGDEIL